MTISRAMLLTGFCCIVWPINAIAQVLVPVDLQVSAVVAPNPAPPGGTVTYTVALSNLGPGTARNVHVAVGYGPRVPFGFVSASAGGSCRAGLLGSLPLDCSWPSDLEPGTGNARTVVIERGVLEPLGGILTWDIQAFADATFNIDTNPANNVVRTSIPVGFPGGPGVDEPSISHQPLPLPIPAFANCPAGYFVATVDDGPGAGLSSGIFALELLLDAGGAQRLEGGLNFGGLVDKGQAGFAGFNIQNPLGEPQRLSIRLTGYPSANADGMLPIRVRVFRQPAPGVSELVYERIGAASMLQALTDEINVSPGFHVVTVLPESNAVGAPGGAAEGQIFFELGTHYVDRAGGGFFGGAVVGGYHATHPSGGVSGFAAFCIASAHSATIRTFSAPEYGPTGAHDLRLQMFDYQRNLLWVRP